MIVKMKAIKQSRKNSETWPEFYIARILEPGLVSYIDSGAGIAMLSKQTIIDMLPSFKGKPIIDKRHKDVTPENYEKFCVGYVTRTFYDDLINWGCVEFMLKEDEAKRSVAEGYRVSCAYDQCVTGKGGEWHAIKYDEEILGGVGNHVALVDEPRYEGGIITPCIEPCSMLINSKQAFIKKAENMVKLKVVNKKFDTSGWKITERPKGHFIVWDENGDQIASADTQKQAENWIKKMSEKDNPGIRDNIVKFKVVNEKKETKEEKMERLKKTKNPNNPFYEEEEKENAVSQDKDPVVFKPIKRICDSCEYLCSNHCDVAGEGGEITLEYAGKRLLGLAEDCSAYEKDDEGRMNVKLRVVKNDKYKCQKCGRVFLSTTRVPGNCPDCDSSDVKKQNQTKEETQ